MVVAAREAPSQGARHVDPVAGPRARPREDPPGGLAGHRERGDERPGKARDIAADDGDAAAAVLPGEPPVELPEPREGHPPVEGEGDNRGPGASAHGCDVAQVALEKLRPGG